MGDDLDELLDDLGRIPGNGEFDDPGDDLGPEDELREKWGVESGSAWQVSKEKDHYVVCEDSLEDGISVLPDYSTVDFVVTDPPYDMSATKVVDASSKIAERGVIVCSDKLAFKISRYTEIQFDLIWYRGDSPRSPGPVHAPIWYHNHCLFFTQGRDTKLRWERPQKDFGSVIDTEQAYIDSPHGQAKTPEVFEILLSCVPDWDVVADPFLGAGGSLIAAERSNRRLYGAELDPAMLAVCLERCYQAGFDVSPLE